MAQNTNQQQGTRKGVQNSPNEDLRKGQPGGRSADPDGRERGLGDQDRNEDRDAPERDKNPDDLE
jgi:hypothetical protein